VPRVSVLLPTHNRADVALLAVASVLAQTESDFELLVVADGCTDDTCARIDRLRDPRIRIFDLPKAPHFGYANRNVALREARGRYVAFAAHDDLLFPDHLAQLVHAIEASGAEWVYSRPLWVSTDGVIVPYAANLTVADELEHFLTVANYIPAACVLHTRECLDRYGYWPEHVDRAADWRYWITIIEGGGRANMGYLPTPTCLHFSANWKQSRFASVGEVRTWLEIADAAGWWPRVLRYPIVPGAREQDVISEAMRAGGDAWVRDVRAAVAAVLDRVAWDDIRDIRPRLGELQKERSAILAELTVLQDHLRASEALSATRADQLGAALQERNAIETALTRVLASASWRLTAPMRSLKQMLTGAGVTTRDRR
jgi:glycosyltransferase involved in cell wall biosynthesis